MSSENNVSTVPDQIDITFPEPFMPVQPFPKIISLIFRLISLCFAASINIYSLIKFGKILPPIWLTSIAMFLTIITSTIGIWHYFIKDKKGHILTEILYHLYVANYSILFVVTIFYWSFLSR